VINFSDQAYLDQDFTSDPGQLQNGFSHLSLSGGTALYDTVVTDADKMDPSATRPRKVLIVISDGDDNSSKRGYGKLRCTAHSRLEPSRQGPRLRVGFPPLDIR
jgi:hypothetical protein